MNNLISNNEQDLINACKISFNKLNKLLFDNKLPEIPFFVIRKKNIAASFNCIGTWNKYKNITDNPTNMCIKISNFFNYTQEQLDGIIAHELIHYYICYNSIPSKESHGYVFLNILNTLNKKQNIVNIPLKHDSMNTDLNTESKNYGCILFTNGKDFFAKFIKEKIYTKELAQSWINGLSDVLLKLGKLNIKEAYCGISNNIRINVFPINNTITNKYNYINIDEIFYNDLLKDNNIKKLDVKSEKWINENNNIKNYNVICNYNYEDDNYNFEVKLGNKLAGNLIGKLIFEDELLHFFIDDTLNITPEEEFDIVGKPYKTFLLEHLEVKSLFRNEGIGKLLLNTFENKAKELKCNAIVFNASPMDINKTPNELRLYYEKHGFKTLIIQKNNTIMYKKL